MSAIKDENQWQAEEDARVLERYQEIVSDKSRLDRAMKEANKMIDTLEERVKAINKSLQSFKKR